MACAAVLRLCCMSLYSSWASWRVATASVRRPTSAYSSIWLFVSKKEPSLHLKKMSELITSKKAWIWLSLSLCTLVSREKRKIQRSFKRTFVKNYTCIRVQKCTLVRGYKKSKGYIKKDTKIFLCFLKTRVHMTNLQIYSG